MSLELTVVISGDASAGPLARLLGSLGRQDYPAMHEVRIVVAEATLAPQQWGARSPQPVSFAEIDATLARFSGQLNAERICLGKGLAATLNACAEFATTPYVLFLESDVEFLDRTLVRRAVKTIHGGLDLVTAGIACRHSGFHDDLVYVATNLIQKISRWAYPIANGKFMLFRKEALLALGGFGERVVGAQSHLVSKRVGRDRFGVVAGKALTDNRWLRETGHARIAWSFLQTAVHGGEARYFVRDGFARTTVPRTTSRFGGSETTTGPEVEAA